jgi:hypothetical protein
MKRYLVLAGSLVMLLLIESCDNDPSPVVCRPEGLRVGTDSILFNYDGSARVNLISYIDVFRHKAQQDELTFNSEGRLITVTKKVFPLSAPSYVEFVHTLRYDEEGRPRDLVSQGASSNSIITEFTHDEEGRLSVASTSSDGDFIGSTRYEYNDSGNITKVFYTLNLNRQITEVLARENFTFDDKEKFYINVPELKICNEYLYAYLPNRNNCLSAKVYYYTYHQRFANPLSVSFQASYNEQGLIQSLESTGATTQLYSGDVLFERMSYSCN